MSARGNRVFVAGHRGLVGSAVVRALEGNGYPDPVLRTSSELDLRNQAEVERFFASEEPDVVVLAAALVGGIHANNVYRWDFIYDNLAIETNVISSALKFGTERLIFLGSSCIYPRAAPQPIREEYLLTGPLEPTNEPYAIAKIAGIKLVEAACGQHGMKWVSLLPTNLYGPGDTFDLERSHFIPAMIRKFHGAALRRGNGEDASVTLWGTGAVRREILHVDDLARAVLKLLHSDVTGLFNVGYGSDYTIAEIARMIAEVAGYTGGIEWDKSRPDGTPRKLLDSSRILATGWKPAIPVREGLRSAYEWYVENAVSAEV